MFSTNVTLTNKIRDEYKVSFGSPTIELWSGVYSLTNPVFTTKLISYTLSSTYVINTANSVLKFQLSSITKSDIVALNSGVPAVLKIYNGSTISVTGDVGYHAGSYNLEYAFSGIVAGQQYQLPDIVLTFSGEY